MTKNLRNVAVYLAMRKEGQTHEQCVAVFRRCGIDIDHVLSLGPLQLVFGEHWLRNTVVVSALGVLIYLLSSWLVEQAYP